MSKTCTVRKTINDYGKDADGKFFISHAKPHYSQIYQLTVEGIWASKRYLSDGETEKVPLNHIQMDWQASEEEIKKVQEMSLDLKRQKESQLVEATNLKSS